MAEQPTLNGQDGAFESSPAHHIFVHLVEGGHLDFLPSFLLPKNGSEFNIHDAGSKAAPYWAPPLLSEDGVREFGSRW